MCWPRQSACPRPPHAGAKSHRLREDAALDALLIIADDGSWAGPRVRLLNESGEIGTATIVGARWGSSGPPVGYLVWPDGATAPLAAAMDLVPAATAISSLVDLLGAVLQLTAAVVSLLAVVGARGRHAGRRGRPDDDEAQ